MGRDREKQIRKGLEIIDQDDGHRLENINFLQDIGNGDTFYPKHQLLLAIAR